MIEVIYDGNLGNNLFQYCFGRILAEKLCYRLSAKPIDGFPRTFDIIEGKNYEGKNTITLKGQLVDLSFIEKDDPHCHILVTGYFQRYEYYEEYRGKIREWLAIDDEEDDEEVGSNDVVMGVRRGIDYIPRHGLPLSYYEMALSLIQYDKVFICTNEPHDPFIIHLAKKYKAIVRKPGALDNIKFIKKFKKIVISNSTFLWWAAFLSDANEVVFPVPKNGFWSVNEPISKNIDLVVDDSRYKYIECEKYKPKFLVEKIRIFCDNTIYDLKSKIRKYMPLIRRKEIKLNKYDFNEKFDL